MSEDDLNLILTFERMMTIKKIEYAFKYIEYALEGRIQ